MTEHRIDPNTGLPELPEGFRWRISGPSYSEYLTIKVQRQIFGPLWVGTLAWGVLRKDRASGELILGRAKDILTHTDPLPWGPKSPPDQPWRKFVGVYPPKKLGGE